MMAMTHTAIADLVTPGRIILMLKAADEQRIIRALSRVAAAETGLSEEAVLHAVLAVRRLTAFGVGRGVAIPHGILRGISAPVGTFARLKCPAHFGAADGRLVDLVFLLLVPEPAAGTLLPLLARVARRLRDRDVLRHLRAGSSAEAAYAVLATDAWRAHPHPGKAPPPSPTKQRVDFAE
jgi:PTS system nitrogen regulatory IIA component